MSLQLVKLAKSGGMVRTSPPRTVPQFTSLLNNPLQWVGDLDDRENVFITLGHHSGADTPGPPARSINSFLNQTMMPWDIDKSDVTRIHEYAYIWAKMLGTDQSNLVLVNSGNGIHIYVHLINPIQEAAFFRTMRPYYIELSARLEREMLAAGLPGKVDNAVFDAARVMRVPGTLNVKPGRLTTECVLVQTANTQVNVDLKELSGLGDLEKDNVAIGQIRRHYPNPDFKQIVKDCGFVKWAMETPFEVKEPHAFDLFSLLAYQPLTAKVEYQGQEMDAQQLAHSIFDHAGSTSLARAEFNVKWAQASKYGARKCSTIQQTWGRCNTCPHFEKIQTPLQIKSPEHISSEPNGYWVMSEKGTPLHPHYQDLAKIFQGETSYITTAEQRLFAFRKTHYEPLAELHVKAWVERKVGHIEYLRAVHRNEFLEKIRVFGAIDKTSEQALFEQSLTGRLNCQNGVLDIMKGELIPHSPNVGFQYVLPYEYAEGETSPYFMEWLAKMTENSPSRMESVLDVMAYLLWPEYDDHVFVFLTGAGKNGKSTLIDVMRAMVGAQNCSSLNVQQLTKNRFAPAQLEGKLANISEESSGTELDSDELNVLKNLSSGGTLQVENKNERSFSFTNRAKLVFSANKIPVLKEQGVAVKRRLLVIPFEHDIKDPDSRVKAQLIAEIPKIVNMLLSRIKSKVEKDGRFMVFRGAGEGEQAQANFLSVGSTTLEWAKLRLESSLDIEPEMSVACSEAYAQYKSWCEDYGYRYVDTRAKFTQKMTELFLVKDDPNAVTTKRVAGKPTRVFTRCIWKEEEL